jgi:hypothetical protein
MKLENATIEVTSINQFLEFNPDERAWKLTLSGQFTDTSQSLIGEKPQIQFNGRDVKLSERLVLISVELLPKNIEYQRVSAAEPWHSNHDHRDTLLIDGLNEGGYIHSQLKIHLTQEEIESIKSVNLRTHRLVTRIQYVGGKKDPRQFSEEPTDQFFVYLTEISIDILSTQDDYYQRAYFKVLDAPPPRPIAIDKIEPVTTLLVQILNNQYEFNKTVKKYASVLIFILIVTILGKQLI